MGHHIYSLPKFIENLKVYWRPLKVTIFVMYRAVHSIILYQKVEEDLFVPKRLAEDGS